MRDSTGKFLPGNPGRPAGSRNRATLAAQALLDGQAEALARAAVERALEGDMAALRLCLERLVPPVRDRAVQVELPAVDTAAGCAAALAGIVQAVGAGDLAPRDAARVAGVLELQRKAIETVELEARVTALERRL